MQGLLLDMYIKLLNSNMSLNISGGEGGIRTHVSGCPGHLISNQRRYDHFGTPPIVFIVNILPVNSIFIRNVA